MLKKKILVTLSCSNYGVAGAEKSTFLILNNLSKEEYDIYILAIFKDKIDFSVLRKRLKKHIYLKAIKEKNQIFKIASEIKRIKPDLIIANVLRVCTKTILANFLTFQKRKIISVIRGLDFEKVGEKMQACFINFFSDKIIVVSKGLKEYLIESFRADHQRIKVIYNPFNLPVIRKRAKEPIASYWNKKNKTIVYVGRLTGELNKKKSINTILEALSLVSKKIKVNLLIIGEGESRKKLEKLSKKLNLSSCVFFLGWKNNPYPYIKAGDCLVLSSTYEGFGRVLVEAMALGIPVISTDCPTGPGEILANGKYGELVPVGEPELMAKAIIKTLKNPISYKLLHDRASVFAVEKIIKRYEIAIKETLTI